MGKTGRGARPLTRPGKATGVPKSNTPISEGRPPSSPAAQPPWDFSRTCLHTSPVQNPAAASHHLQQLVPCWPGRAGLVLPTSALWTPFRPRPDHPVPRPVTSPTFLSKVFPPLSTLARTLWSSQTPPPFSSSPLLPEAHLEPRAEIVSPPLRQCGQCCGHVILPPVPQHRISGYGAAGEQSSSRGRPPSSRVPWPRSSCSWMETGPSVVPTGDSAAFRGLGTEVAPVPSWFLSLILSYDTLVIPVHGSQNC